MAKYYVEVNGDSTFWHKDPEMKILHRLDGPAIEEADGYKAWWVNGKRHREDGPAVEFAIGTVQYWLKDKKMTKEQWEDALRPPEELTVAQIEKLLGKRIKVVK